MTRLFQPLENVRRGTSNRWESAGLRFPILGSRRFAAGAAVLLALAAGPAGAIDAKDQLQFADGLYSRGLFDLAAQEYRGVATNPAAEKLDVALFRLAECERQLGRKPAAVAAYTRLVREFPKSEFRFRGEYRNAELHVTGGEFIQAVNLFRALLAANPPDDIRAPSLYYRGFAEDRLLLTNDAEAAFGEVVARHPASPFFSLACVSLGELQEKRGAPPAGPRDLYTKAAATPATPRVGAEALFKLADLEFRHRVYAASADAYTRLLATYPKDERTVSNQLAIAWSFHNAGRFPAAQQIAAAELPAAAAATRAEWLYVKASSERQMAQHGAAIADYAELLAKHPGSPLAGPAAYEQAVLLFQQKRYADVLAIAPLIASTNAAGLDACWMLAESHAELKQIEPAIANCRKIVEQYPQSDRAPLAQFRIGKLLQEAGRLEEASAAYRLVAKNHPAHALAADALAASANCQLKAGRKEGAVADWAALAAQQPGYAALDQMLFAKAQAEVDLGRVADAKATLEQFIKTCPKSPLLAKAHYTRGALQEKSDELDPAAYHYAAALALKPDADMQEMIRFRRIAVLQRQGKNDEAAAMLQPVLATPAQAKIPVATMEWLARWQLAKNDYAAAEEAATNLIARTKDEVLRQSAWYVAGLARQALTNLAGARVAFEAVAAATNAVPSREAIEASLHLGEVLLALNDAAAATAAFARSAEQAGTDALLDIRARSYHGLGLAAAAQGKWEEAARYFMSVAVLFDDAALTPECLYRAADAFGRQGRADEKQKTREELKRRYPGSEWAKKE